MPSTRAEWANIDPTGRFVKAIGDVLDRFTRAGVLTGDSTRDVRSILEGMDYVTGADPEQANQWRGMREQARVLLTEDMTSTDEELEREWKE